MGKGKRLKAQRAREGSKTPGQRRSPVGVLEIWADYARTATGWKAAVILGEETAEPAALALGSTLDQCQREVMQRVGELADRTGRPCQTVHMLDGDPAAFVEAYHAEVGFGDTSNNASDGGWVGSGRGTDLAASPPHGVGRPFKAL